ncbi:MAG: hypothetical protein WA052_01000 [Microgenomates group bacterium]
MSEQEIPFQWAEPEGLDEPPELIEDDGLSYTNVAELLEKELDDDFKRLKELDDEKKRLRGISTEAGLDS